MDFEDIIYNLSESTVYLLGDQELLSLWEDAHKRTRILQGFEDRAKAGQTKHFEYDGTAKSYKDNMFKTLNRRDQRSIIRNERKDKIDTLKGKQSKINMLNDRKSTLSQAPQVTDMRYRTIGHNTNPITKFTDENGQKRKALISTQHPEVQTKHEDEHIRQGNLYRQKYGKQDLIRMQNDYEKKSLKGVHKGDKSSYLKDGLEASANRAALGHQDNNRKVDKLLTNAHKGNFSTIRKKVGEFLNNKMAMKSGVSAHVLADHIPDWIKEKYKG